MDINCEDTQETQLETQNVTGKRKTTNEINDNGQKLKQMKLSDDKGASLSTTNTGADAETFANVQLMQAEEIKTSLTGREKVSMDEKFNAALIGSKEISPPARPIAHQSPKKRLQLEAAATTSNGGKQKNNKNQGKEKFIYGNYNQYYGYRNKDQQQRCGVSVDIRLEVFATRAELFRDKDVLDIGCNSGLITMEVAKRFAVKSIIGLDIDRTLVNQANKALVRQKKALPVADNEARRLRQYPYNGSFVHGNYVLADDVLLEIEHEQFDVILCLSITKWIHLNFGDAGLKQAFRRMYMQLRCGGKLILEAQPFDNYKRRKKMTETISANYKAMQFLPKHFTDYLLSADVGFASVELMGVPEHCTEGFKRAIQIFHKK